MRLLKSVTIVFIIILLCGFSNAEEKERLWISFLTGFSEKYLMQIDPLGNLLLPPFKVQDFPIKTGGVTALSFNGNSSLNFWLLSNGRVYKAVIDKKTLNTIKLIRTNLIGIRRPFPTLEITSRELNNFIGFEVETPEGIRIAVYPINEFGRVVGKRRFITPIFSSSCNNPIHRCNGGISANGRLSYWMDVNPTKQRQIDLFIRPLGNQGLPIKEPVFIDKAMPFSATRDVPLISSADLTGALAGTRRFAVYVKAHTYSPGETLLLQQLNSVTGELIGLSIKLYRNEEIGNVKVDPLGRFVLFSLGPQLVFLGLDPTGQPSGSPKVLTSIGSFGIDLLREKL